MRLLKEGLSLFLILVLYQNNLSQIWQPDLGNGNYKNPIIWADYSDPDIIRVGDNFYMTSSSFNCVPALPILHSKDLVNWKIINHAVKKFPDPYFNVPQHGNGVWAPSIRFHNDWFYIFWGDPDKGIFMVRTEDPSSDWSAPVLIKKAVGNIDACPFWDDDGKVYIVHAFANSRSGVSHVLQLQELDSDDLSVTKNRDIIIQGLPGNYTLEGSKMYKRNGWYYIFAPAGGVAEGWQMVYRSKNIWGPYEEKRVLEQGSTNINGPHQGGWIELENGENWFIHFQEKQPYGRIVHLQPVVWIDDWPVMGIDLDGNQIGEPVSEYKYPTTNFSSEKFVPQTTDEFNENHYNLAWQWQANYFDHWFSLNENKGQLRLFAQYQNDESSIWMVPNIIAQKLPAPSFTNTTKIDVKNLKEREKAGLVVMGRDYAYLSLSPSSIGYNINLVKCKNAMRGYSEVIEVTEELKNSLIYLQAEFNEDGYCQFSYSIDNTNFKKIGKPFKVREGRWIGARVGLFALSGKETGIKGYADFDWFRIN